MTRCIAFWAALTASLLVVAGALAGQLTPAQYRADATSICKIANQKLSAVPAGATLAQYIAAVQKIEQASNSSLSALDSPNSLAILASKMVDTYDSGDLVLTNLLARAKATHLTVKQFQSDPGLGRVAKTENALWTQLGVPYCASH
jgi:hypothetical protein